MLLARHGPFLLFGFARSTPPARPSYGFALKVDGRHFNRPLWRVFQIGVYGPAQRRGRGCWAFEAVTWRTREQKTRRGSKGRVGVKAFLRLKIGLGGYAPEER